MGSSLEFDDSNGTASIPPQTVATSTNSTRCYTSHGFRRFLFLLLGTGSLITYNSFLSCIDYFDEVNPEVTNISGRIAAVDITALFLVTILLLPISTFSGSDDNITRADQPHSENKQNILLRSLSQPSFRVAVGFSLSLLVLFIFLVLPPPPSLTSLLLFCSFSGAFDALVQSGLYVFAASYHEPTYSAAATLGTAVSGVFANVLRLATKAIFQDSGENGLGRGADLSLWLCFGFIIICTLTIFLMIIERNRQPEAMLVEDAGSHFETFESEDGTARNGIEHSWKDNTASEIIATKHRSLGDFRLIYIQTFAITWKPTLSVFLNLFFTLALYPAIIISIPSSYDGLSLGTWLPVTLLLSFNVGDCAGRAVFWVDSWPCYRILMNHREHNVINADIDGGEDKTGTIPVSGHNLLRNYDMMVWWPTIARLLFFPLFALCVKPNEPHPYIHSDIFSCILVLLFGLSNGYVHCANFTCTPTMVDKEEHRNAASLLLVVATTSGLALGSYLGIFLFFYE